MTDILVMHGRKVGMREAGILILSTMMDLGAAPPAELGHEECAKLGAAQARIIQAKIDEARSAGKNLAVSPARWDGLQVTQDFELLDYDARPAEEWLLIICRPAQLYGKIAKAIIVDDPHQPTEET